MRTDFSGLDKQYNQNFRRARESSRREESARERDVDFACDERGRQRERCVRTLRRERYQQVTIITYNMLRPLPPKRVCVFKSVRTCREKCEDRALDGPASGVGPTSNVILAREWNVTDWKQCHGCHGL